MDRRCRKRSAVLVVVNSIEVAIRALTRRVGCLVNSLAHSVSNLVTSGSLIEGFEVEVVGQEVVIRIVPVVLARYGIITNLMLLVLGV